MAAGQFLLSRTVYARLGPNASLELGVAESRCHSGFVPARKCSGGTYLLADLFPRNISASVDVPPGTFPHTQKCSGQRKCSASAYLLWLLSLDLSHKDKEILLSPTAWTTDTIVNAAQLLLRQQFPQLPGLQDVSLGQTMAINVCASEFVQILHTSQDHWLTVSTIGVKRLTVNSLFDCLPQITSLHALQ